MDDALFFVTWFGLGVAILGFVAVLTEKETK